MTTESDKLLDETQTLGYVVSIIIYWIANRIGHVGDGCAQDRRVNVGMILEDPIDEAMVRYITFVEEPLFDELPSSGEKIVDDNRRDVRVKTR